MSNFFSAESFCGNWVLNWMIRSPCPAGLLDKGIPSPDTSLLYCGLYGTGFILENLVDLFLVHLSSHCKVLETC